jgi:hypothetical protein
VKYQTPVVDSRSRAVVLVAVVILRLYGTKVANFGL